VSERQAQPATTTDACASRTVETIPASRARSVVAARALRPARRLVPLALAALLVAGCASADKNTAGSGGSSSSGSGMAMGSSGSSSAATGAASGQSMIMPSSDSDGGTVTETKVAGLKAVPTTVLASTTWEGMRITAEARSPLAFLVPTGTGEKEVKPGPNASFHLMVMLNDAQTGVTIPYAGVWATITRAGKIVYDERQWAMISRYMGPHYGNDVTLPGSGTYHLSLLISPPVVARHMEYANVWNAPHHVSFTFHFRESS